MLGACAFNEIPDGAQMKDSNRCLNEGPVIAVTSASDGVESGQESDAQITMVDDGHQPEVLHREPAAKEEAPLKKCASVQVHCPQPQGTAVIGAEAADLLERPPEILVAYLAGQPEAVAAIELLKEAQRVWNNRDASNSSGRPSLTLADVQPVTLVPLSGHSLAQMASLSAESDQTARRYSHDDIRVAYTAASSTIPAEGQRAAVGGCPRAKRRASELPGAARYQKNIAQRPKRTSRQEDLISRRTCKQLNDNLATAGRARTRKDPPELNQSSNSSRRSSLAEAAALKVSDGQRRPSRLLLQDSDHLSVAASHSRRSSKASAIFLVSPSAKEGHVMPQPEPEEGSPEDLRRRRTISIIATVGAFLLVLSILLVTITLRLATHIDDLGTLQPEAFSICPLTAVLA